MAKSTKEYLARNHTCPFCDGESIIYDTVEVDSGGAYQDCTCQDCKGSWQDCYKLTGYVVLEQPDVESEGGDHD